MYYNLPGQKVIVNDLPETITLNVKTSGFNILSYHFSKKKKPVEIDVDAKIGSSLSQSTDVLILPTNTFSGDFNGQLGNDISIVNFIPDSIVFNFSYKSVKRVPVKPDIHITFEKQYDSTGSFITEPDSVYVSGPGSLIGKINFITTEQVNLEKVKEQISKKVRLKADKLLSLSDTMVKLTLPVEKFTEENLEIPVTAIHVQTGYSLKTFPDKIIVRYQVALSKYNQVTPFLFEAVVDASKSEEQKTNKMSVQLVKVPSFVRAASISPERVDYILRKQ